MKNLIEGVIRFQRDLFPQRRDLFEGLATGQKPAVMMIACSDSRVDPNLFTQTGPGDIFVLRNAGNFVPPYGEQAIDIAATVEYAVQVLGVQHIVVCGHTDCGAMKASMHPEKVTELPAVAQWLRQAQPALAVVKATAGSLAEGDKLTRVTEENVVAQLQNLATHPSVAAKLRTGDIALHGWVYAIGSGDITVYDSSDHRFVPIASVASTGAAAGARA